MPDTYEVTQDVLDSLREVTDRRFHDKVDETVRRLRKMADRIEREGRDVTGAAAVTPAGTPKYGNAAAQIVHGLTWDTANLSLAGLIEAAAEADRWMLHADVPEEHVRARVAELVVLDRDCTQDESAEIKRLLDGATEREHDMLATRWPLEHDEWHEEVDAGIRSFD